MSILLLPLLGHQESAVWTRLQPRSKLGVLLIFRIPLFPIINYSNIKGDRQDPTFNEAKGTHLSPHTLRADWMTFKPEFMQP